MRIKVMYQSQTGNTRKVAEAIARVAGCTAEPVGTATVSEPVDVLFLGAAIHGGHIEGSVKKFIEGLDPILVKKVTVFSTGFEEASRKAVGIMKDLLTRRGVQVTSECYVCRGKYLFINRIHPDAGDLAGAEEYARSVLAT